MSDIIYIAHFDDEPLSVEWLPMTLLDFWIDTHGAIDEEEILENQSPPHGGYLLELPLQKNGKCIRLIYEIIPEKDTYLQRARDTAPDIVILDLMQSQNNGGISRAGVEIFKDLAKCRPEKQTIILHTAYPEVSKQIAPDDSQYVFFPKPADGDRMVRYVAKLIEEILKQPR